MDKNESLLNQTKGNQFFKTSELLKPDTLTYDFATIGTNAYYYDNSNSSIVLDKDFLEKEIKQILENCLDDDLNIVLNFLRKRLEEIIDNPELALNNESKIIAYLNDIENKLSVEINKLQNKVEKLSDRLDYLESLLYSFRSAYNTTTTTSLPNSMNIQF